MTSRSTPAVPTVTVGAYLARRLVELGGAHLFGLPGDFNLSLLDEMLEVPGIEWVGNTNELNAAYAADAYARTTRGVAALVTTYGVGELSAVNGIAGSYAEDVPVVQVTGMPETGACQRGALLHHSLADGDHEHFARAYREVTATGSVLRAADAALEIDRVLRVALERSKPVYLGIPADVAVARVSSAPLRRPLRPAPSDPVALDDLRVALAEVLADVPALTVLAGTQVHRRRAEGGLAALAGRDGVRVATLVGAKAMLPEQHPASLGTYQGAMTISPDVRRAVDEADLLVLAGAVLSDVMTGLFSHGFDPSRAVRLGIAEAVVDGVTFHDVRLEDTLPLLAEVVRDREFAALPPVEGVWPHVTAPSAQAEAGDGPLTQHALWRTVQGWLPEDAIVVADAGTSLYGAWNCACRRGPNSSCSPSGPPSGSRCPPSWGPAWPPRTGVRSSSSATAPRSSRCRRSRPSAAGAFGWSARSGRRRGRQLRLHHRARAAEPQGRLPGRHVLGLARGARPVRPGRDVLTARAGTRAELEDALDRIAAAPDGRRRARGARRPRRAAAAGAAGGGRARDALSPTFQVAGAASDEQRTRHHAIRTRDDSDDPHQPQLRHRQHRRAARPAVHGRRPRRRHRRRHRGRQLPAPGHRADGARGRRPRLRLAERVDAAQARIRGDVMTSLVTTDTTQRQSAIAALGADATTLRTTLRELAASSSGDVRTQASQLLAQTETVVTLGQRVVSLSNYEITDPSQSAARAAMPAFAKEADVLSAAVPGIVTAAATAQEAAVADAADARTQGLWLTLSASVAVTAVLALVATAITRPCAGACAAPSGSCRRWPAAVSTSAGRWAGPTRSGRWSRP